MANSDDPVMQILAGLDKRDKESLEKQVELQRKSEIEQRAATVALDLLRRSVSDLTTTMASNAARTPPTASTAGGLDRYNTTFGLGGSGGAGDPGKSALSNLLTQSAEKGAKGISTFSERLERGADRLVFALENPTYSLLKFGQRLDGVATKAVKGGANLAGKMVTDPMAMLAGKFAAILGPMTVFSQILESNNSGFSVLSGAVKLLASTLAPVLLPVVAVVAAGMVELSDKLWGEISPALEDFYAQVVDTLIPAVEEIVKAFMDAVRFIEQFSDPLGGDEKRENAVAEGRAAGMTDDEIAASARDAGWSDREISKALKGPVGGTSGGTASADGSSGGGSSRAGGDSGGGSPAFRSSMSDVLKELRLSMGPRAGIGDIGSVGKNFQLAALNQSPFETKMLERMDKAVSALERVAGRSAPTRAVYSGDGDFSGATGVGGDYGGDF